MLLQKAEEARLVMRRWVGLTLTVPPALPYSALPCPTLPYPTLTMDDCSTCHALPSPTLPCPTLPYPTLPMDDWSVCPAGAIDGSLRCLEGVGCSALLCPACPAGACLVHLPNPAANMTRGHSTHKQTPYIRHPPWTQTLDSPRPGPYGQTSTGAGVLAWHYLVSLTPLEASLAHMVKSTTITPSSAHPKASVAGAT